MKYAVIRISGRQYKVKEGEEIVVDRLGENKLEAEVLLVADGEKILVGKPTVKEAKIKTKVLGEEKGEKIDILRYKAKSRYVKHLGFRPSLTRILIEKISV